MLASIVVLAAAVAAGVVWFTVAQEPAEGPAAGTEVSAEGFFYYIQGRDLSRVDLVNREVEDVRRVPAVVAAAMSPDGRWLAYIPSRSGGEPQVAVLDLETGDRVSIGSASFPVWDPTGAAIAFRSPLQAPSGQYSVRVARADRGFEPETLLSDVNFAPVGWTRDRLVLFDRDTGEAALLEPGGEPEVFATGLLGLWGVSPDDRWAIVLREGQRAEVVDLQSGASRPLDLDGELLNGRWRPDGALALAPVAAPFKPERPPRMALIDPAAGSVRVLPDSDGATGFPFWDPNGGTFTFLQSGVVKLCQVDEGCSVVLRITEEIIPLGLL